MKILYVVYGLPRFGGMSVFCGEMLNELTKHGFDCRLLIKERTEDFYPIHSGIKVIVGDFNEAISDGWIPDIVHINGLWYPWLSRAYLRAKKLGAKIVWSTHGMLRPYALKKSKLKKQLSLALYQKRSLAGSDIIHVTSKEEAEDVRRLVLNNEISVVPLGVKMPHETNEVRNSNVKTALFLGRVIPIKGLFNLVEAWSKVKPEGWRLVIAGPSEDDHIDDVLKRAKELGLESPTISYVGAQFGETKDKLYLDSDLFVLPSYSENFGVVVLEALAAGLPVITTKGTPWAELEEHNCGKWIDIGVDPLVKALRDLTSLSDAERNRIGDNGRRLVEEKYSWSSLANQMAKAYMKLLSCAITI